MSGTVSLADGERGGEGERESGHALGEGFVGQFARKYTSRGGNILETGR